jgi:hypothetical protein
MCHSGDVSDLDVFDLGW